MGNKNPSFAICTMLENVGEYGLPDMSIKCREGILAMNECQGLNFIIKKTRTNVKDDDIRITVYSPADVDSLLLTTGKRNTLLADHGQVVARKRPHI